MTNQHTSLSVGRSGEGEGASAVALGAGMTAYGPSHPDYPNAPSDWDHGPYLCRDGNLYHMRGYGWAHGLGCWNPEADWDRIAYTAVRQDEPAQATNNTISEETGNADPS